MLWGQKDNTKIYQTEMLYNNIPETSQAKSKESSSVVTWFRYISINDGISDFGFHPPSIDPFNVFPDRNVEKWAFTSGFDFGTPRVTVRPQPCTHKEWEKKEKSEKIFFCISKWTRDTK